MELKLGPITKAWIKKLKASFGIGDSGMVSYIEEALKNKFEEFQGQVKTSKLFTIYSISKDYSREKLGVENWLKVLQSKEVILERIWNQFYNQKMIHIKVVSGKPPIEGQFELSKVYRWSCAYSILSRSWNQGRPQARDGRRGDKVEENIIDHMEMLQDKKHGEMIICLNILERLLLLAKQTVEATMEEDCLSKTNLPSSRSVLPKPQASTYKNWPKKEDTPKVAFKDHSKPKVEGKGRLITNPTRCFKCNGVGHIAINHPTKGTLF
ncbi:hypothetical protein M9H77_07533 [Catharanthus roseus]|uniref:Uncharacterized protein n=1 Tax=Catharanthus roseus TaxID=4058 RepID=A0ACC0BV86_CATRO|nr:hypothetical protein M9H77_07533 [Catharanthus roseus]